MRVTTSLIILLVISLNLQAQLFNGDSLTTITYWEQGESYKYQLEKYKYKKKGDEITEHNSVSQITLYIQEETDSNYMIKYTIDSLTVKGQVEDNPIMDAYSSEISKNLIYMIETDENGSLIEIRNWEEISENILKLSSQLNLLGEMDEEEKEKVYQMLRKMTDSKEKVQAMYMKEFQVLFANYGYVFDTRDTIEYEQQIPNPYGGSPFPQYGKIFFDTSFVDSNNSIVLYDKSSIDEEKGKEALIQVIKQISPDIEAQEDFESEMTNIEFKIEDTMIQEFNINYGFIINAIMERKIISNDSKENNTQITRQTWTLLEIIEN